MNQKMQPKRKIHNLPFRLILTIILILGGFAFPILFFLAALVGWSLIHDFWNQPQEIDAWFTRRWTAGPDDPNWKNYFLSFCESPAETAFLEAMISNYNLIPKEGILHGNGITLDLQVKITPYRADFVVNNSLIIEIDGATYHSSQEAIQRDKIRDEFMQALGFSVLRIPARIVFSSPNEALKQVSTSITEHSQVQSVSKDRSYKKERKNFSFLQTLESINIAMEDINSTINKRQTIEKETKKFSDIFHIEKLAIEHAISLAISKIKKDEYISSLSEKDRELYFLGEAELQEVLNKSTNTPASNLTLSIPVILQTAPHSDPEINDAINNAIAHLKIERNNFFDGVRIQLNNDAKLRALVQENLNNIQCGECWKYIS